MKLCKNCDEKMKDTVRFCTKCGEEQIDKTDGEAIVVDNTTSLQAASKTSAISRLFLTNEKKDFASNMSIRQFFLEARKEEYNEQTTEKVKKFLEEKEIIELWPVAIITLEELGALYHQWERAKDGDTMSFAELGELQKELKTEEEKLLDQFEKLIKDSNNRELLAGYLSELEEEDDND
jgi:RNA polymerase subunit RPABC4/transcription elongation factor Spt4